MVRKKLGLDKRGKGRGKDLKETVCEVR